MFPCAFYTSSHSLIEWFFAYLHVYFTLQYLKGYVDRLKVVHIFTKVQVACHAREVRNYTYMWIYTCVCILLAKERCTFMVHLYLCLPDQRGHKIHKSKGDRQCKFGQKENVCLFCSYVFSVCTGQADRGMNAPLRRSTHEKKFVKCTRLKTFCLRFPWKSTKLLS